MRRGSECRTTSSRMTGIGPCSSTWRSRLARRSARYSCSRVPVLIRLDGHLLAAGAHADEHGLVGLVEADLQSLEAIARERWEQLVGTLEQWGLVLAPVGVDRLRQRPCRDVQPHVALGELAQLRDALLDLLRGVGRTAEALHLLLLAAELADAHVEQAQLLLQSGDLLLGLGGLRVERVDVDALGARRSARGAGPGRLR